MDITHYIAGVMALFGLIGMFIILGIIGNMDYEDAKAEEAHYNDMVCHGYWPDYERRSPKCD